MVTDFGADLAFAQVMDELVEHYGIVLSESTIRHITQGQAARVDGCTTPQMLTRIVFPLVMPGLAALSILVFVFSWNEFAVALNLTAKQTATVPVAIAKFAQEYEIKHGVMAAGAVLSVLPAIIVLLLAQRHIVKGLTTGAVK